MVESPTGAHSFSQCIILTDNFLTGSGSWNACTLPEQILLFFEHAARRARSHACEVDMLRRVIAWAHIIATQPLAETGRHHRSRRLRGIQATITDSFCHRTLKRDAYIKRNRILKTRVRAGPNIGRTAVPNISQVQYYFSTGFLE